MTNQAYASNYQEIEKYIARLDEPARTLCNNALLSLNKLYKDEVNYEGNLVKNNIETLLSRIVTACEENSLTNEIFESITSPDVEVLGTFLVREIQFLFNPPKEREKTEEIDIEPSIKKLEQSSSSKEKEKNDEPHPIEDLSVQEVTVIIPNFCKTFKQSEKTRKTNIDHYIKKLEDEKIQNFLQKIQVSPADIQQHIDESVNTITPEIAQMGLALAYHLIADNLEKTIQKLDSNAKPTLEATQDLLKLTDSYTSFLLNSHSSEEKTSINVVERTCLLINLIDKTREFVEKPKDSQTKIQLINADKSIRDNVSMGEYFKNLLNRIIARMTFSPRSNTVDSTDICNNLDNITPRLTRVATPQ